MKKILTMALISILTLSGCSLFNGGEEQTEPTEDSTEVSADSVLDNQVYGMAVDMKDESKCEKISSEDKKEECKNVIESLKLTDKAEEEMDKDYCDDIKIDSFKENCEELVDYSIGEREVAVKEQERISGIVEIEQEAVDKGDHSICEEIEDEGMMYSCKKNVIINQALKTGDQTLCSKLEEQEYIDECIVETKVN